MSNLDHHWGWLESPEHDVLCVEVLLSTQTEAKLYLLTYNEVNFIQTINYTSALKSVVIKENVLHALTDAALETYATQSSRKYPRNNQNMQVALTLSFMCVWGFQLNNCAM